MRTPSRKAAPKPSPQNKLKKDGLLKSPRSSTPSPSPSVQPKSKGKPRSSTPSPSPSVQPRSTPNTRTSTKQSNIADDSEPTSVLGETKSVNRRGKNKMDEYPQQRKFCYTAEELHEEYGLSLEGKLAQDLDDDDLPTDQWLTVFKHKYQKKLKIYLNHLQPHLYDDCRFLYYKVYQAPPSCGEITSKFAHCYAYEKCHAATKDPVGHRVAWARFGESVVNHCKSNPARMERKIETWRRLNGSSHGGQQHVDKKPRVTQSGSNICTDVEMPFSKPIADYIPDLEAIVDRMPWNSRDAVSRLDQVKAAIQEKKDKLLVYGGKEHVAISIMEDIAALEARQEHLLKANPTALDEIREVQCKLAASKRLLQRHGVADEMKKLKSELQQH